MNYFVLSPNVYKDGIEKYRTEMEDRHIAIMGWSKGESTQGNTFSNLKINDRIILAHGANRNKRVFFAGIVASEPKPYLNGESQYVDLYKFTNLEDYHIPFTENNTYGAANLIASIYKLKESTDAGIISAVERALGEKSYNIRDVGFWAKHPDEYISIPSVQRSLVWKPAQIELLWDSILRGFPIGAFMLSEINNEDANNKEEKQKRYDEHYYLVDGQQRFNAIAQGYNSFGSENSIVWFDLEPSLKVSEKSTRKYWVKLTNKAHPWGYKNNDECHVLSAAERREALRIFELDGCNIYNDGVELKNTFPVTAGKPIPLFWMLTAPTMNQDVFVKSVMNSFEENSRSQVFKLPFDSIEEDTISMYYECFKRVKKYQISINLLTKDVMKSETQAEKDCDEKTDLEVLFNRIGKGGTAITENELLYSAIKVYWPRKIKEVNDELASLYMPPVSLIMLAFRLALTTNDDNDFRKNPSLKQVRVIGVNKTGKEYKSIEELYYNELKSILDRVNSWLSFGNVPPILRTTLARKTPTIYLLLMYLEKRKLVKEEDILFVQALAFYLFWLRKDKVKDSECVETIYKKLKDATPETYKSKIIESIISLTQRELLYPLYTPEQFEEIWKDSIGDDPQWRPWGNKRWNEPWWPLWSKIVFDKDMLLYAQREYLNNNFKLYNPAQANMWEEHNRPWDYDHIVPKDWIHSYHCKRIEYTEYCEAWLNHNGNLAAIPFEKNRGKSNKPDWTEYIQNRELLLCDEKIKEFEKKFTTNLQADKNQAHEFAVKTANRDIRIYRECYSLLNKLFENGIFSCIDSNYRLSRRKSTLEKLQQRLEGKASILYRSNNDEYPIENEIDWARPKIVVGIICGERMICVYYCFRTDNKQFDYKIGIARSPHHEKNKKITLPLLEGYEIDGDKNERWYLHRLIDGQTSIEDLIGEIDKLISYNEKC